ASYKYQSLNKAVGDIRPLTLLPGHVSNPIHSILTHVPLLIANASPSQRMMKKEIKETLPPDWKYFLNLEGGFIFTHDTSNFASWPHPNENFDHSQYEGYEDVFDLEFQPEYDTLSYTWGAVKEAKEAFVSSGQSQSRQPSSITLALGKSSIQPYHISGTKITHILWFGSICINQADEIECKEHTKRMQCIYFLVRGVVVWLGPRSDNNTAALQILACIGVQLECSQDNWLLPPPGCKYLDWHLRACSLPLGQKPLGPVEQVVQILNRDRFDRVWTMQEIVLANWNPIMCCGYD
ncbi:hypothetical protein K469DRAFT_546636, partial [Zopfia rhizophila CBS 207.26]